MIASDEASVLYVGVMLIHNVLAAACDALKVSHAEFQAEGRPVVDGHRYDTLASWIARQALPKLSGPQRAEVQALFALLEKAKMQKLTRAEEARFECDESATGLSDPQIVVSGLKMDAVKGARRAGIAAARLLGRPFLEALANELWRLDAISLVAKQALRPVDGPEIRESLWRGATGARITHHLVRLEGDRHGLIAKTRGQWMWFEGSRDDMVASVPDALLKSVVATLVGGEAPKTGRRSAATELGAQVFDLGDEKFAAVTVDPAGTAWLLTRRGQLGALAKGAREFVWSKFEAKGVRGLVASKAAIASWGAQGVVVRRGQKDERITASAALGAHLDEEGLVWWDERALHLGKKTVRGLPKQSVSVVSRRVFVVGAKQTLVVDRANGRVVTTLPVGGAGHVPSSDGARLAVWSGREVRQHATDDGRLLFTSKLDSGDVDSGCFLSDGRLLVRYHGALRVAFIAPDGRLTQRVEGRKLGTAGSTVRVVFSLSQGAVLGFASYPRGEAVLVDSEAQTLGRWQLGTLFVGGVTRCAEGGGRVLVTHDFAVGRALVF